MPPHSPAILISSYCWAVSPPRRRPVITPSRRCGRCSPSRPTTARRGMLWGARFRPAARSSVTSAKRHRAKQPIITGRHSRSMTKSLDQFEPGNREWNALVSSEHALTAFLQAATRHEARLTVTADQTNATSQAMERSIAAMQQAIYTLHPKDRPDGYLRLGQSCCCPPGRLQRRSGGGWAGKSRRPEPGARPAGHKANRFRATSIHRHSACL